tara:strand:+ start:2700 stop:3482 length:783 start_codon:yes stop_codon:yes gene_type:complete
MKLSDIIYAPLSIKALRKRVIFYLKHFFYPELEFEIPVGENLIAPITFYDSYDSFSEIFLQCEYDFILEHIDGRNLSWLDIGCNNGYFSLWLERELQKLNKSCLQAVLIDADSRSQLSVPRLIQRNELGRFSFINKAIGKEEFVSFYERPFMASSTKEGDGELRKIQTLRASDLEDQRLWDLIKVDIEGSEWELIQNYEYLLLNCRFLLLEWHSWHAGGGGKIQLLHVLNDMGFRIVEETSEINAVGIEGSVGVILLEKC